MTAMQFPLMDLPDASGDVFRGIEDHLSQNGFMIINRALNKPWGGFFVIEESQAKKFADFYFPEIDFNSIMIAGNLSPKILAVAPGKRLSWQYHFRRAEIWRLVAGTASISTSDDDVERYNREIKPGEVIRLRQGERHRLIGLDGWGMIAEIWQHTVPGNLSDESDIVRLQDDFIRN
jgi:mannose-6-phosphate isomerase-like protein (cupin superfamily)